MDHHSFLHRRDLLRLAGLSGAAWMSGAAGLLGARAAQAAAPEPAQSIIVLWLAGGPSQLETFDPHPGSDIAAGTEAIATAAPDIQLAAGFEQLAEQMRDVSLVRSLVSREGDHERGTYYVKSGYRPDPTAVYPSIGAVICHQLPVGDTEIPRHVSILPGPWPSWGGYLGAEYDAFKIDDPAGPLPDVEAKVSPERFQQRMAALSVVERAFARGRAQQVVATRHTSTVLDARQMMSSEQLAAFDVSREPARLRERYGDTPFGRGCLAARRLIEKGVRCVEVTLVGWDSHVNNHSIHRNLVATLDPAFATLVADLRERDLLSRTVVLCGGEFGRTPQLNALDGRDHWPHNFAFAMAGGRIAGGRVLGETDPQGGKQVARDESYQVADLHATVLEALDIDPEIELFTPADRPVKLSEGRVLEQLLS